MHPVKGRLGQTYLLCRNKTIDVKYPRQPVANCLGYARAIPVIASADERETDSAAHFSLREGVKGSSRR